MVTRQEKQRLMQAYATEPVRASAVIAKCSVGLALLAGLAAISTFSSSDPLQAQSGAPRVAQLQGAR